VLWVYNFGYKNIRELLKIKYFIFIAKKTYRYCCKERTGGFAELL